MMMPFVYSLSGGMLVVLATGRPEEIAWRFLRFAGLLAFAPACAITVWSLGIPRTGGLDAPGYAPWIALALLAGAMGVTLMAPWAARAARVFRVICAAGGVAGLLAACATSSAPMTMHHVSVWTGVMIVVGTVLGGLMIGSITIAWLLGHAYLTATKMTIAPLRHFSRLLTWAVGLRVAFLLVSLTVAWLGDGGSDPSILTQLGRSWLVLSMRIGMGLVAVGAFALMVRGCVKLRATQSATGILYFGSVFAYIGELASQHMLLELGWPT